MMQNKFSISRFIANAYIKYCEFMPNHRGRYRLAQILDNLFNSFTVKTPSGLILEIFLSSSMDLSYFYAEQNSSHNKVLEAIEQLTEGDIFIDIGANIGFFAILASKKVGKSGRIICFEPSFREFNRLLKNILLNKITNVLPYNIALADYIGDSNFVIASSHTGLNLLSNKSSHNENCILVPVFTGDLLLQHLTRSTNKILKIDVEGAEFKVISGMKTFLKEQNIKTVIVEITPDFLTKFGHSKEMVYSLMKECGYKPSIESTDWQYDEVFIPNLYL